MRFGKNDKHFTCPSLMLGVSMAALIIGGPAFAQDQPAEAPPEAAPVEEGPVAPQPADQEGAEGTIVVTGSRIRTVNEFNSPDPITVIDPALSAREGKLDTAATLQSSPIAAGSTQITAAISSNFVTNGGPGAQTIDLRGLGANRTLVLLNGRRAGPAGTRGGVSSFDLNVLPQSIAQNVQILKTGASSVYGSDAVAGVVNIITKTDLDGFELDASSSVPFDSGGEQYRISGIWGKKFDRGHVMIAGDYFKQRELARGDRSYLDCPENYVFDPDTGDRADLVDPRTGEFKCEDPDGGPWGQVWVYDYIGNLFQGGVDVGPVNLVQFQYPGENLGLPPIEGPSFPGDFGAPPGWYFTGYDEHSLGVQNRGDHPFNREQTLIPETKRITFYADASYEITDNIEVFGEFLFNRRKTYQNGWRQIWTFGGTDYYNALYGNGPNIWAQGWTGYNTLSPTPITNHSDSSQKVDYWRGVGGFRGDFGGFLSGWSFDSYFQYSHNDGRYRNEQFLQEIYNVGLYQGFGYMGSCVGETLPVSGKQCIDLPWTDPFFLRGEMTPEQIDFMFDWEEGKTIYKQLVGEFSVSGPLFELPGGTVSMALGATARRDEIKDTPGEITLAGNAWGASTSGITAGHSVTKEIFGEINVPVLRDRPFFKDLTFSGGARVTNVKATRASDDFSDSSNGNWTYKLGGNWAVNDWLRFRGTYGTSYRAPALFEQFLADETSFAQQRVVDPCVNIQFNLAQGNISQNQFDNCFASLVGTDAEKLTHTGGGVSATVITSGGIGVLEPETSKAWTVSAIFTPRFDFLPDTRFDLAIDYFHIKVDGEIAQLGARNILYECYDSADFPTDPLCDLFTRGQQGAPNNVNEVFDKYINIASQTNAGIDVTANIRHDLGRWGKLNFLASMTWQTKDDITLLPGSTPESDNGESGSPKWVGDFNLTWQPPGGWTIFYGIDVIGKTSNLSEASDNDDPDDLCFTQGVDTVRPSYCLDVTAPMKWYHSASMSKEIGKNFEMTLGLTNIFDTRPPRVSTLQTGLSQITLIGPVVAASQYDFIGRRVFVNVKRKF